MLSRQKILLSKIEGVEDTDPTPVGANAILTYDLNLDPYAGDTVERNQDRAIVGARTKINVNPHHMLSFGVEHAGAGVAGRAPSWGLLLLGCGFSGAASTTDSGTLATGSTSAVTLASGASSTSDVYNGMLLATTTGTGSGQTAKITDYNGTTKVATLSLATGFALTSTVDDTTGYAIKSKYTYTLVSPDTCDSLTHYFMRTVSGGQELHNLNGCRGNMSIEIANGQIPMVKFDNFLGTYNSPSTVSAVTPDWSLFQVPLGVTKTNTPTVTIGGYSACLDSFTLNLNNSVVRKNRPNCRSTRITDRQPGGNFVIRAPEIATKDVFSEWVESHAAVQQIAAAITHGTAAGGILALSVPQLQVTKVTETDLDGELGYSCDYVAPPTDSGNDELSLVVR